MQSPRFVLVVVDRDTKDFTAEGPMADDRPWNKAVADAQRVSRNIRCLGTGDITPDAAAAQWQAAHGGRRLAAGSIVRPDSLISALLENWPAAWSSA